MTRPTGARGGGNLTGERTQPHENDSRDTRTDLRRENDAAEALNRAGYRVHQIPGFDV